MALNSVLGGGGGGGVCDPRYRIQTRNSQLASQFFLRFNKLLEVLSINQGTSPHKNHSNNCSEPTTAGWGTSSNPFAHPLVAQK